MEAIEFYIGEMEDALSAFQNPPYGHAIDRLVKAAEQVIVAYDEATGNTPGPVQGEDNQ